MTQILRAQQNEITEYHIYSRLARRVKDKGNSRVLQQIADEEKQHHDSWAQYTNQEARPRRLIVFLYYWIARVLGLTFGIKLMEKNEERAQINYSQIVGVIPEAQRIIEEEEVHEQKLIALINEERLNYTGSIVLGLNDALVELTGTLAGLTFALQNTKLTALAGLITGIAASFSMAASEYLSQRSEGESERASTSALYTGVAYICTVALLILPYLVLTNYLLSLVCTLVIALAIIFAFNYYISVAKDLNFRRRFTEMALISMGVALVSFAIGYLIRVTLGVDI
ncbi:MAG: rubrerythrin family protein [Firmicutes bacterium]|nr:rubrerythrin family protein [Bacillota bacterium]